MSNAVKYWELGLPRLPKNIEDFVREYASKEAEKFINQAKNSKLIDQKLQAICILIREIRKMKQNQIREVLRVK